VTKQHCNAHPCALCVVVVESPPLIDPPCDSLASAYKAALEMEDAGPKPKAQGTHIPHFALFFQRGSIPAPADRP